VELGLVASITVSLSSDQSERVFLVVLESRDSCPSVDDLPARWTILGGDRSMNATLSSHGCSAPAPANDERQVTAECGDIPWTGAVRNTGADQAQGRNALTFNISSRGLYVTCGIVGAHCSLLMFGPSLFFFLLLRMLSFGGFHLPDQSQKPHSRTITRTSHQHPPRNDLIEILHGDERC